jgi:hypothetical protein
MKDSRPTDAIVENSAWIQHCCLQRTTRLGSGLIGTACALPYRMLRAEGADMAETYSQGLIRLPEL